ncbi:uncharacterized protein EV422DRAFT_38418 [Fimicolochytrium jonesii]|uniref:uncharacterized protein n=1 Tax=Fimicolochytrium jonesii TaxID=1396493 RepID=UPI0022FE5D90|nr:uncharacterized protein EV422DRAFT_38418 [Fimicolochytrium jonesii]KAI8821332.1 hypothetical protein EV422DRAFT_38418 [Fimicolochytrium jonesii]
MENTEGTEWLRLMLESLSTAPNQAVLSNQGAFHPVSTDNEFNPRSSAGPSHAGREASLLALLQEQTKAKELELLAKKEDVRLKELELQILLLKKQQEQSPRLPPPTHSFLSSQFSDAQHSLLGQRHEAAMQSAFGSTAVNINAGSHTLLDAHYGHLNHGLSEAPANGVDRSEGVASSRPAHHGSDQWTGDHTATQDDFGLYSPSSPMRRLLDSADWPSHQTFQEAVGADLLDHNPDHYLALPDEEPLASHSEVQLPVGVGEQLPASHVEEHLPVSHAGPLPVSHITMQEPALTSSPLTETSQTPQTLISITNAVKHVTFSPIEPISRKPAYPVAIPRGRTGYPGTARRVKRHVKASINCRNCSEVIGDCLIHGTEDQLANFEQAKADYACAPCAEKLVWTNKRLRKGQLQRKRKTNFEPSSIPVACVVCKKLVAAGAFTVPIASAEPTESTSEKQSDPPQSRLPEWGVELLCAGCRHKYMRCSNCGGGGAYLTGKWRPAQLFAGNRATCTLPHTRYSGTAMSSGVWVMPHPQFPCPVGHAELLEAEPVPIAAIWKSLEIFITWFTFASLGRPKFMEYNKALESWDLLHAASQKFIVHAQQELKGEGFKSRAPFTTLHRGDPCLTRSYLGMIWTDEEKKGDRAGNAGEDPRLVWRKAVENPATKTWKNLPRTLGACNIDWEVSNGLIHVNMMVRASKRILSPLYAIICRIKEDHEALVAKAVSESLTSPVPPKYILFGETIFANEDSTENDSPTPTAGAPPKKPPARRLRRGHNRSDHPFFSFLRPLADVPDCGWTLELEEAANEAAGIDSVLGTQAFVGDFDAILEVARGLTGFADDENEDEEDNSDEEVRPREGTRKRGRSLGTRLKI